MRVIKFRVWDRKKMVTNNQYSIIGVCVESGDPFMASTDSCESPVGWMDNCIIMQFTGLHDKNGKEIYEGDILKVISCDNDYSEKAITVEFKNGGYCIEWDGMFYDGSDVTLIYWAMESDFSFEVIGNMYENPELITP